MKAQLRSCLVVLGLLPALICAGAKTFKHLNRPVAKHTAVHAAVAVKRRHGHRYRAIARDSHRLNSWKISRAQTDMSNLASGGSGVHKLRDGKALRVMALDSITKLLRLKLYLDQYDWDDIAIAFNSGASVDYNPNEDSKYMPGIDAAEGLASISADGVDLSINFLPLPAQQTPDIIWLDVEAQNSGPIALLRTELDSLPKVYQLWLVDNYKKDSVNLRTDTAYTFDINKADTTTYGKRRFKVVVSQDPAQQVQLVGFNAVKAEGGAQITWTAENESTYTHFAVERSTDGGSTFIVIDSLLSNGTGNYTFTDKTPPQASDQYRLRTTDFNGTVSYSNVITLIYSETTNTISGNITLYPNPTNGVITVNITGGSQTGLPATNLALQSIEPTSTTAAAPATAYTVRIVNVSGIIVKTAASSGGNWQDNVSALSPGTYIISVTNNSTGKMIGKSTFVKL